MKHFDTFWVCKGLIVLSKQILFQKIIIFAAQLAEIIYKNSLLTCYAVQTYFMWLSRLIWTWCLIDCLFFLLQRLVSPFFLLTFKERALCFVLYFFLQRFLLFRVTDCDIDKLPRFTSYKKFLLSLIYANELGEIRERRRRSQVPGKIFLKVA